MEKSVRLNFSEFRRRFVGDEFISFIIEIGLCAGELSNRLLINFLWLLFSKQLEYYLDWI